MKPLNCSHRFYEWEFRQLKRNHRLDKILSTSFLEQSLPLPSSKLIISSCVSQPIHDDIMEFMLFSHFQVKFANFYRVDSRAAVSLEIWPWRWAQCPGHWQTLNWDRSHPVSIPSSESWDCISVIMVTLQISLPAPKGQKKTSVLLFFLMTNEGEESKQFCMFSSATVSQKYCNYLTDVILSVLYITLHSLWPNFIGLIPLICNSNWHSVQQFPIRHTSTLTFFTWHRKFRERDLIWPYRNRFKRKAS